MPGLCVLCFPSTYLVSVKYSAPGISTANIKLVIGGILAVFLTSTLHTKYHVRFTSNPTLYFIVTVCMEHHTCIVYFTYLLKLEILSMYAILTNVANEKSLTENLLT